MKILSTIILIVIYTNLYSQIESKKIKKEYINTYLGTYSKDTVILDELLSAPMVNSYNIKGQLIETNLLDSIGGRTRQQFTYSYNIIGDVLNETYGNGYDEIWSNEKNIYNNHGKIITKTFCDSLDNNCNIKIVYDYDIKNNLIKETKWKNSNIERIHHINITYEGEIIKTKEIKEYQDKNLIVHTLDFYKNNKIVHSKNFHNNSTTSYTYYKNGREKTSTRNFGKGDKTQYTYLEFDKYGNPIIETWVGKSGYGEISIISYEYY